MALSVTIFPFFDRQWKQSLTRSLRVSYRYGFCDGETGRTTIHKRDCCEGQRRGSGLLSHICVSSVWGNSRNSWLNWALRLRLLFTRIVSTIPSTHPQGRSSVEQVLQISATPLYRGPCWGSFYLHPILDFPLRNGACILKCYAYICDSMSVNDHRCIV